MKLVVDTDAHAAYLYLTPDGTTVHKTVSVTVNVDFDDQGNMLGVEFLQWPIMQPYPGPGAVPEHPFLPGIFGGTPNICDECGTPRNDHATEYDWHSEEARDPFLMPPTIPITPSKDT